MTFIPPRLMDIAAKKGYTVEQCLGGFTLNKGSTVKAFRGKGAISDAIFWLSTR